jgi:DNA polymerase
MTGVEIDFETRSDVPIKLGVYKYFESPHARVLGGSYQINHGPMRRWDYGQRLPDDLRRAIDDDAVISAHNAGFEIQCFEWLHRNLGWPMPRYEQFRCTAATAAAMSLPRALDTKGAVTGLAEALGLEARKDKEGSRLIKLFSIPRKPRKGEDPNGVYFNEPEEFPEDYTKFQDYRDQDVIVEAAADKRMVPLSNAEQAVWQLTELINRRGIRIDRKSAHAALRLAEKAKTALDREMRQVTGGAVKNCSTPGKLVEWVNSRLGVRPGLMSNDYEETAVMQSAGKAEITDLLESDDLPADVRRALEIRQEAAKTSVSKLQAMLDRASADGRVRGGFIYHQAGTGRTQSVGVNWNNLPRPRKVYDDNKPRTDLLFEAFRREDPELLAFLYPEQPAPTAPELARFLMPTQDGMLGRSLHLISDAIRGFIWAAPGHDLLQADFSNIEGNVIAWTSGEDWKVQAIFDLIADPSLPDMYRRTAASILNTTTDIITKKHPLRQGVGKPAELGLSFGGGVMAFVTFARNYGVRLDPLFEPVWAAAEEARQSKAVKSYESYSKRGLYGTKELSRNAWIACEIIKLGWRSANSAIAQSWKDLEAAVRQAVEEPGTVARAAKVDYLVKHGFLWARLPSGRCLAYAAPKLKAQVWAKVLLPDGEWSDAEVMDRDVAERRERMELVKIDGRTSDKVTFLGVNSTTKRWERSALYGGLLAENNTQAIARDLLVNGMFKAEEAGYPIIATVYDEIITEVPRSFGNLAEFEKLICELPTWAKGLPLTAGGWRGKRYRKD